MNFAERAMEIARNLPLTQRLPVLARFAFMEMTAGRVDAARRLADEIDDGVWDARASGTTVDEIVTELASLESWIERSSQEKPDPRQEGIDLAEQILLRPHALPRLAEAIRTGKLPNLGSRAIGDAAEELYRRGEHAHAAALLDGVANTEAGHRARLRTGLLLKQEAVAGVDAEALVAEAIDDAARMDRAEGKSARRQFLAGVALMSFDDVDLADGIVRQLYAEGHSNLSAGVKQRLARGLLDLGRVDEALRHLASIQSNTARELATAAVLEQLVAAAGLAAARSAVAGFGTPAAAVSVRAKLAEVAADSDPATARADLAAAFAAMAPLRGSDPFFYQALCDVMAAQAAVPDAPHSAEVAALLAAASPFPAYRLRLAEHLGGALVRRSRAGDVENLLPLLDAEAAAVILFRASLP